MINYSRALKNDYYFDGRLKCIIVMELCETNMMDKKLVNRIARNIIN